MAFQQAAVVASLGGQSLEVPTLDDRITELDDFLASPFTAAKTMTQEERDLREALGLRRV